MKKRFTPRYRPYPIVPRPKKKINQEPSSADVETKEYQTSPEDRPAAEHYMPGSGCDDGMMPMHPLAEAHVRWQRYGQVYNPVEALQKGTIFPELYRPYYG